MSDKSEDEYYVMSLMMPKVENFSRRGEEPFCNPREIFIQARPRQWMLIQPGERIFAYAKVSPHLLITNCNRKIKKSVFRKQNLSEPPSPSNQT